MICERCGKKPIFLKKVAHDRMYVNGRSNRKVKPNLQHIRLEEGGATRRTAVCTRCLRTMRRKGNLPRQ